MEECRCLHVAGQPRRAASSQQRQAWTSQTALEDNAAGAAGAAGARAGTPSSGNTSFIEDAFHHLQETMSREQLQLLTRDVAWTTFVAMADFSRDEADALREALREYLADTEVDLQAKKRYLKELSKMILELEKQVAWLYDLADRVDTIHRNCTVSSMVTSSISAASEVMNILGLALAPVTAGGSLLLSATGVGLCAVAAIASVATDMVKQSSISSAKAEARGLVANSEDPMKESTGHIEFNVLLKLVQSINALKNMKNNIHAFKVARACPPLLAKDYNLMRTGTISFQHNKQLPKAIGSTTLAMSKGARIMGAATAGVFLLVDVYNLVQDSKHLEKGVKTGSAAELRQQAQSLERKLRELMKIQVRLQLGLSGSSHSTRSSDRSQGRCVGQRHRHVRAFY